MNRIFHVPCLAYPGYFGHNALLESHVRERILGQLIKFPSEEGKARMFFFFLILKMSFDSFEYNRGEKRIRALNARFKKYCLVNKFNNSIFHLYEI